MTSPARSSSKPSRPVDQAHGLRQMFPSRVVRFIPVVSNPQVMFGGVVLERLCAAFAGFGLKTLVVDAGERARTPSELANFDLAEGIEQLTEDVHYMPARGLPLRHVDAQGSSASLICALGDAAPQMDVVLLHASASELVRAGPAQRRVECAPAAVHRRARRRPHARLRRRQDHRAARALDVL